MEGDEKDPVDFPKAWYNLLKRPNIIPILNSPMTHGRKMIKVLTTLSADFYGELEYRWLQENRKKHHLQQELNKVRSISRTNYLSDILKNNKLHEQ